MNSRAHAHAAHRSVLTQRGIATIEFAICAPILLLLMLATAELGRLLYQYNTLAKAVRDGARYVAGAATNSTGTVTITPEMRLRTQNLVVTGNIAGTGAPILPNLTTGSVSVTNTGQGFIAVSASFQYQPMVGAMLPMFGFGQAINLSMVLPATVVMRA